MTNVSKPVIPAVVADALDQAKAERMSNESIIDVRNEEYPEGTRVSGAALRLIPFDTLLVALVNGYERELTEEERLYESIAGEYEWFSSCDSDYDDGVCRGIILTLNTLGIKIEGVNA